MNKSILISLIVTLSSAMVFAYHSDVECQLDEQVCYVRSMWHVRQSGSGGCWCAATIMMVQSAWERQDEYNIKQTIGSLSGLNTSEDGPGLFCYCDRGCLQGMKGLLIEITGLQYHEEIYLLPINSEDRDCVQEYEVTSRPSIYDNVKPWIQDKRPFAISWRYGEKGTRGHIVVVYGYDLTKGYGDEEIWYMDPLYGKKEEKYSKLMESSMLDNRIMSNGLIPDQPLPVHVIR